MKKVIMCLLTVGFFSAAFAQTTSWKKRPTLSVNFLLKDFITPDRIGSSSLSSVLTNKDWAKTSSMSPGVSVQYFQGLSNHVDFMGRLGGLFVNYPFLGGKPKLGDDKFLLEADANINIKLLTDKYFLVPYLSVGVGASMYAGTYYGAYIPVGTGLQFNLGGSESFLFTQFSYHIPVTTSTNNYSFNYSLGFGSPLVEKKEVKMIPPPPPPMKVEPMDTDKDGIIDSLDKCPTVPGVAKYDGCPVPDTDRDGINDENDKCPTVPGVAKYGGCPIPDTDKDGINDEEDKCIDVPGLARYQGCPIPDTDKDGLNDEVDKCPTVAGPASNEGCPIPKITEEKKKKVEKAATNIYFATGSAILLKKSNKALDEIVALLKEDENSTLGLDVEGHTDNVGSAKLNHNLSHARAKAVMAYFKKKGIDEKRLSAAGYGLEKPIADNKTAAGRAKNRRVEMKLREL
ncbi:MAG: OmpA family protein [Chitinophagaceae bacterium]|nr:OmpA family protein [Chitinophagaceae bacterium]